MEKSEPTFVPEWLRSKGGSGLSHHFVSSQADRRSSSNSQRSSSSNGSSNRHDKNPYSRSYSSSTRNQFSKDRQNLGAGDAWGLDYYDPLPTFTGRPLEKGFLGRSKSTISSRVVSDLRNRSHYTSSNGNGAASVGNGSRGIQVSFDIDFPSFRCDERSTTPDIIRIPSPGLSKGVQGLSIENSPLLDSENQTSTLAKGHVGAVERNSVVSPDGPRQPSNGPLSTVVSNGFDTTEALVQAPVQSVGAPQTQKFEELCVLGNKRLIPMTSSVSLKTVLNPSDKLKPKTAARSNNDGLIGPKNGLQQISSANGPSTGAPSLTSVPLKNANNMKHPNSGRKTSAYSLNVAPVADKRSSLAHLRSRNDFLNLMRKKSLTTTSADGDSGTVMQNIAESKETTCSSVGPTENGEGKCNGDACKIIHTAEELEFLHALGWEDDAGDDEGLTEEEINAFVNKYMTSKPAAKLLRGLQSKMPIPESQGLCNVSASSEVSVSNTQI